MTEKELQEEEREVLSSIYDGDDSFKEISFNTFQYKYGESDTVKSFLLELQWGEKYPNEIPKVNMDTFYNKHLVAPVKEKVASLVLEEANQYIGMSMTYSIFEFVKEKFDEVILDQPKYVESTEKLPISLDCENISQKAPKKEQLTKAQKRRQWNRLDNKGEKPRGWDWVDIVKHLSQTGPKEPTPPT